MEPKMLGENPSLPTMTPETSLLSSLFMAMALSICFSVYDRGRWYLVTENPMFW